MKSWISISLHIVDKIKKYYKYTRLSVAIMSTTKVSDYARNDDNKKLSYDYGYNKVNQGVNIVAND